MHTTPCIIPWDDPSFEKLLLAGVMLERDDDYLRALLQELEQSGQWMHISSLTLDARAEALKRHFHMMLLADAGFLAPMSDRGEVFRITNAGHDFLALTRQTLAWETTKLVARSLRGASLQMLMRIAEGYARQKLAEMGVPLG